MLSSVSKGIPSSSTSRGCNASRVQVPDHECKLMDVDEELKVGGNALVGRFSGYDHNDLIPKAQLNRVTYT